MFQNIKLFWSKKAKGPLPPAEVPKSFTMESGGEEKHIYRVSMGETYADFVDVAYKKLSYAEAAALSKDKEQTSRVAKPETPLKQARRIPARERQTAPRTPDSIDDEHIQEKIKTNNYFLKNKVYKQHDRFSRKTRV